MTEDVVTRQAGHGRRRRLHRVLEPEGLPGPRVWAGQSVLQVPQHLRGGPHLRPRPGGPLPPPQLQREGRPAGEPRLLGGGSAGPRPHGLLVVIYCQLITRALLQLEIISIIYEGKYFS